MGSGGSELQYSFSSNSTRRLADSLHTPARVRTPLAFDTEIRWKALDTAFAVIRGIPAT